MYITDFLAQETTMGQSDIKYILVAAVCYGIYRVFMNKFVMTPLSKFVPEKSRFKFIHRGFDCIHYVLCGMIGILAFLQRPYAHCAFYFADCREYNVCTGEFVCSIFQKIYFYIFISYYISDIFWIRTTKDIPIMCIHHTVTLSMMLICIITARPAAGISIMVLHDIVDIFLYIGKIATYLGIKKISDSSLFVFAVTFFYLRLFNLATIIYTVITDKSEQPHHKTLYTVGRGLLCLLYCCHLVWGSQIVKAIQRILKGDRIHDTRSDDGVKAIKTQ
ncbi:longevity assurance protein [Histomonas meleagridis]|uniref:longevity assurance protein n=1 Tax=Histomonas meleagridis TaxID=135588 RepID=UPI00355968D2|nr:longevity assurance protein [Histomonas meleagridis]KAH0796803.1 longevity assurance protein [Histomonas meleagridis]